MGDSLKKILQDGSTLDASVRLSRNNFFRHFLLWQIPPVAFVGLTSSLTTNEANARLVTDTLSYLPMGLASVVGALGTYAVARGTERRKIHESEQLQTQVRTILGEPVDVFRWNIQGERKRSKGKKRTPDKKILVIRWYGLQGINVEAERSSTTTRLERLLEATAPFDVDTFIFDSEPLSGLLGSEIHRFGRVEDRQDSIATHRVSITDLKNPLQIVVATRQHCKDIIKELKKTSNDKVVEQLASLIREVDPRSAIPNAVSNVDLSTIAGLTALERVITQEILDREEQKLPLTERYIDEYGESERVRTRSTVSLSGDTVTRSTTFRAGDRIREKNSSGSLLASTGHSSLDSLLTEIVKPNADHSYRESLPNGDHARVAILLFTQQRLRAKDREIGSSRHLQANIEDMQGPDHMPITLFERMVEEPARTVPKLKVHGALKKGEDPTLEYRRRTRFNNKWNLGIAFFAIAITYGPSYEHGVGINLVDKLISDNYQREHEQGIKDGTISSTTSLNKYIEDNAAALPRTFHQAMDKLRKARNALDTAELDAIKKLGVSDELIDTVQEWARSRNNYVPPIPGNIYMKSGNEVEVGDVPATHNQAIYKVAGKNGATAAGYWYTDVNNYVEINGKGVPPYKNIGVTFTSDKSTSEIRELKLPASPPTEDNLMFEVTAELSPEAFTSRFGTGGSKLVSLPIKSGTKVAAITVEDASNSEKTNQPIDISTTFFPSRGVYTAALPEDAIAKMGKPILRYWLENSKKNNIPRAVGPMIVKSATGEGFKEIELYNIISPASRTAIAHALKLPSNATDKQMLKAISTKKYSFTPLADSDRRTTDTSPLPESNDEAELVLRNIGKALAGMSVENCNTAGTVFQIATGGTFNARNINVAAGFNNDGDGELSSLESHTWAVDERGEEIDPTPAGSADIAKQAIETSPTPSLDWQRGAVGVLAGLGVLQACLFLRRRYLPILKKKISENRFAFLDTDGVQAQAYHTVISVLNHSQYAPEGTPREKEQHLSQQPLVSKLVSQTVNPNMSYREGRRALRESGIKLSFPIHKALYELTKSRNLDKKDSAADLSGPPPIPRSPVLRAALERTSSRGIRNP